MANNRMYLVNKRTGSRVYVAKYYPSTGWFFSGDALVRRLEDAFCVADFGHLTVEQMKENARAEGFLAPHKSAGGMYGAEWSIEYEVEREPGSDEETENEKGKVSSEPQDAG